MRYRTNSVLAILILLIFYCCSGNRNISIGKNSSDLEIRELKYYQLFTEATKHGLFGNNKSAESLYNTCIKEFPERAAPYYQLSSIYLKTNQVDKAVYYAKQAATLDTINKWYKIQLANIYQYTGQIDSAIIHYEKLVKSGTTDDVKYNLAMLYIEKGNGADALKVLSKLKHQNLDSKEIMLMKHNVYHSISNYDSALYWLENLTLRFPDDVNSYGMLAEYLTEIGKFTKANEVYNKILKMDPGNGLVLLSFAEHYVANNKIDSANEYYHKAFCESTLSDNDKIGVAVNLLKKEDNKITDTDSLISWLACIKPESRNYTYYAILVDINIKNENFEDAKYYIDSALVFKRDNFMLWEQALLVNNFLNDDKEVVRISTECLEEFDDKYNLYLVRAYAYSNIGLNDSAINDIDTMLVKPISNDYVIQGFILLAELYRKKNENDQSDYYFEKVIDLDESNLVVKNNYAYYLAIRGEDLEKAVTLSKYAVQREPKNPTYLDTYGWVLYKKGDYKQAKEYVELAIRYGAYDNAEVLEHYGDIMMELDKCIEALEAYEKVGEIEPEIDIEKKINLLLENCEE